MNNGEIVEEPKEQLEKPDEHNEMIESATAKATKKIMESLKPLFEAYGDEEEEEEVEEKTSNKKEVKKKKTLKVTEPLKNVVKILDNKQFLDFKREMVDVLKSAEIEEDDFNSLVTELESTKNVDNFNIVMDKIYDYADSNNFLLEVAQ